MPQNEGGCAPRDWLGSAAAGRRAIAKKGVARTPGAQSTRRGVAACREGGRDVKSRPGAARGRADGGRGAKAVIGMRMCDLDSISAGRPPSVGRARPRRKGARAAWGIEFQREAGASARRAGPRSRLPTRWPPSPRPPARDHKPQPSSKPQFQPGPARRLPSLLSPSPPSSTTPETHRAL